MEDRSELTLQEEKEKPLIEIVEVEETEVTEEVSNREEDLIGKRKMSKENLYRIPSSSVESISTPKKKNLHDSFSLVEKSWTLVYP